VNEYWGPAGVVGILTLLINQYFNWRKERRVDEMERVKLNATSEERDEARYRAQMDEMVKSLERRVVTAEAEEADCLQKYARLEARINEMQLAYEKRMADVVESYEKLVRNLTRKLADNGGNGGNGSNHLGR
jgi:hypothetical protein